jgi:hypothetical protein
MLRSLFQSPAPLFRATKEGVGVLADIHDHQSLIADRGIEQDLDGIKGGGGVFTENGKTFGRLVTLHPDFALDIVQVVKMNRSQSFRFIHVFLTRPESKSEVFLSLLEVPSKLKIIHLKHPCYISTVMGYCQEKRITLRILQGVVTFEIFRMVRHNEKYIDTRLYIMHFGATKREKIIFSGQTLPVDLYLCRIMLEIIFS